MSDTNALVEKLQQWGVGRRSLHDGPFGPPPPRLGLRDEDLYRPLVLQGADRYRCAACGRALPAPHLLQLHVQEAHDSYFAAAAARGPAYCCYVQECAEKFATAEDRFRHGVAVHGLPKDFRFETRRKGCNTSKKKSEPPGAMEVDGAAGRPLLLLTGKRRGCARYSGKTFTSDDRRGPASCSAMDDMAAELRRGLPP